MVPILLASSSASHGLHVAEVIQADPGLLPGGRDRDRADPGERLRIVDGAVVGRKVAKPSAKATPPEAGLPVAREAQPTPGRGRLSFGRRLCA